MILGIDEVGRGAWAGPVVVGAAAIDPDTVAGLNDSKLLSKKKRVMFARLIREHAAWVGIGWISAKKIDEIGMSAALKLAAERAVAGAPEVITEIIIDGTIRLVEAPNVSTLKKADQLIPAVSAASIIAKVARDHYMYQVDELFPQYGFGGHVGYGTASHRAALDRHGPTPLHRMSFSPMAGAVPKQTPPKETNGSKAEAAAAAYLQQNGFEIIDRNWKTRRCEIDIIAKKADTVYCVEVKYRQDARHGAGFDYITGAKQTQMQFAAEMWRSQANWRGPIVLAAAQVAGESFAVTDFVTEIPEASARPVRTRQFGS